MKRVLIADDSEGIRNSISIILEQNRYQVATVDDGEAAMRFLRLNRIDLLITDIQMPGKNGLHVIRELRDGGWNSPIIAMSGGGDLNGHPVLELASRFGADASIEKPFSMFSILDTVDTVFQKRQVRKPTTVFRPPAVPSQGMLLSI